jgi:hypothetical protein
MTEDEARSPGDTSWSVDTIPYDALRREQVKDDTLLLYIVASASFVEITSDVYTRNLSDFFRGDADVVKWLERSWESEEQQHGRALKRYVETAWPDFDWDGAYSNFLSEFTRFCSIDQLAQTGAGDGGTLRRRDRHGGVLSRARGDEPGAGPARDRDGDQHR